ncbi:biopolymer transporter ExbB, partial [Candidatus Endoriftia persephone str. Guaymas]|nr:biopolymer transporter ExbB [Candidatus Endoriftia persephone str. Guaymas]
MDRLFEWMPMETAAFLDRGGPVLWLILLLSLLMWLMIALCYSHQWWPRGGSDNHRGDYLGLVEAMVQILPMLGLLGTVEGMIDLFHVMASHGSGNIRGMSAGISTALITTMA